MSTPLEACFTVDDRRLKGMARTVAMWLYEFSPVGQNPAVIPKDADHAYETVAMPIRSDHYVEVATKNEMGEPMTWSCLVSATFLVVVREAKGTTHAGVSTYDIWSGLVRINRNYVWDAAKADIRRQCIGEDQFEILNTIELPKETA
jgi:hypothetical protein